MTTRKAGKAIGGGKLTQIMGSDGRCIGTINETLGVWIVTIEGAPFEVYHSFHQALTAAARLMKVAQ